MRLRDKLSKFKNPLDNSKKIADRVDTENQLVKRYEQNYAYLHEIEAEIKRLQQEIENLANDKEPGDIEAKSKALEGKKGAYKLIEQMKWDDRRAEYCRKLCGIILGKEDITELDDKYIKGQPKFKMLLSKYKDADNCKATLLGMEYESLFHVSPDTQLTDEEKMEYGSNTTEYIEARKKQIEKLMLTIKKEINPEEAMTEEQIKLIEDKSIEIVDDTENSYIEQFSDEFDRLINQSILYTFDASRKETSSLLGNKEIQIIISEQRQKEREETSL